MFLLFLCLNISCPFFVFLHLAPAHLTIHLNSIYLFFSLVNSFLFAWDFSLWARHPLQSFMPSSFATLFFLNFFYQNITTYNTVLSGLQLFSPIPSWTLLSHTLRYILILRESKLPSLQLQGVWTHHQMPYSVYTHKVIISQKNQWSLSTFKFRAINSAPNPFIAK